MLTINADDRPLMKLMHRPDPKRPPEMQDKRMVAVLPEAQHAEWLDAPPERSMDFMRQYSADRLAMTPEPTATKLETQGPTMKLSHLALTVIEDPDHEGRHHWLLLRSTGDADRVEEHSASDGSFSSAVEAFEAGAVCWCAAMNTEDEDADPVGGDEPDES